MIAPWAKEEVEHADLGDHRLDQRLVQLLSDLGHHPTLSIPAAWGGRAEIKAAYRFFDHDQATFDKILEPHLARTKQRLAEHPVVLLVQDTTHIEISRPQQEVRGLGELDGARRGFLLHEMQAFTPEGVPLGTAWAENLNRTEGVSHAPKAEKAKKRKSTPLEDKESVRWLTGLRKARDVAQSLPGVSCVCVGDSESDIYELFTEPRGEHPVDWLIRAGQNRALKGEDTGTLLREAVLTTPVLYEVELRIRGRQAKTQVETSVRRQTREGRVAKVEVRAKQVTLRPPPRPDGCLAPVTVNVVQIWEPNPPDGEPRVEWTLVTTLPIETAEQVRTVVEYYCVRWCIEILFRTLKSGCRIEHRRFEDVDRLLPCLGLYLIVAWRTMFVCRMGRSCPEMDCEVVFEPSEWKAVWVAVRKEPPPKQAPT